MNLFLSVFQEIQALTTCAETEQLVKFNETVSNCCSTCNTGSGVTVECSFQNDTTCEQCTDGKTYSDVVSIEATCKTCATCDNNTYLVLHPCNTTHNTVCTCPDGYYFDPEADKCKLCDLCPAGWGAVRKCNGYDNTICAPCVINGSFSNKLDYYSLCEGCTTCVDPYFTLQECSTTEDAICMSKYNIEHLGIMTSLVPLPNDGLLVEPHSSLVYTLLEVVKPFN